MFKKLLSYDFKSIWRIWVICALAALGGGILGAFSISMLSLGVIKEFPFIINAMFVFWMIISVITISAFAVASPILLYIRFYRHFFSDEGYLTFTLPVKRSTLLISKTVNALIWNMLSYVVLFIAFIMLIIAGYGASMQINIFSAAAEMVNEIGKLITDLSAGEIFAIVVLVLDALLIILSSTWFGISLAHLCITFGATIARKHKVLAAIGVYYGVNTVASFVSQFLSIIASLVLTRLMISLTPDQLAVFSLSLPIVFFLGTAAIAFALDRLTLKRIKYNLNMA